MQVLDAPRGDAVDEQAARRPLWMHAAGLLVVLVALLPLVGTSAVFSADEGAALIQARRVVEDGTWVGSHPLPDADQEVLGYPVHLAEQTADGWHELTRHPLYIHLVATTWSIGGFPAAMLLSMLATAGAALASGALAGHLDRRLAVPTLWAVGLASPLLFDGYLVIAHSAGALGAALAALLLVGRWHRAHLALGAIACAGVVLLRSEGLLLGLALSAALLATGARQRHRGRLLAGWTVGVATVGAYLFDGWWTSHLKGPTIGTAGPGIGRFQGGLRGRWEGFERTWLWVGRGGLADGDELILLAVIVAGAAAVALRRGTSGRVVTTLGA
ncbi:MAG: hypothetical protein OES57_17210, partial [Acidimicrobiia bacterium]|nr:hypothetical protein [Acidimicrobiia bacterium]